MSSSAVLPSPPPATEPPEPWEAAEARQPSWDVLRAALAEGAGELLAHGAVRGHAVAYRTRNGALEPERCLVAFVKRKQPRAELDAAGVPALPDHLSVGGYAVPVDVVETGRIRRNGHCGFQVGMNALGTGGRWGTLGMVARDRATGHPLALTAMHLSGSKKPVPPAVLPGSWKAVLEMGKPPVTLGPVRRGTMDGVDAAGIAFDPSIEIAPFLPGVGWLRDARAPTETDLLQPVHMFGAASGYQSGSIVSLAATFPSLGLKDAFVVRMKCTGGDSGAACCTMKGVVLGLHVATLTADPKLQLFCPIDAVLNALQCTFN
ncbi:MAG TPA: hypothetical protein VE913_17455 [Longimicrobium sp.]|nr:hypothetical protein [Longimicrobium sp.]